MPFFQGRAALTPSAASIQTAKQEEPCKPDQNYGGPTLIQPLPPPKPMKVPLKGANKAGGGGAATGPLRGRTTTGTLGRWRGGRGAPTTRTLKFRRGGGRSWGWGGGWGNCHRNALERGGWAKGGGLKNLHPPPPPVPSRMSCA